MLDTLRTLFRARQAETEEALIDAHAISLLAQHLRDAKVDTGRARQALATLTGRRNAEQSRIGILTTEITRREDDARSAIGAGETELVADIADHIARLEDERAHAVKAEGDLLNRITALRSNITKAERRIATLTDELRLARSQTMHRTASGRASTALPDTPLRRAEETAERLRQSSAQIESEIDAMENLSPNAGNDLDARIRDAGLDTRAATRRTAILERITNEKNT